MILNPNVTSELLLDKRFVKQDGTMPVKLRITYLRTQKYYNLKYSFTESEFEEIMTGKIRTSKKEMKFILLSIEKKARSIIDEMPDFSFKFFEQKFLAKKVQQRGNLYVQIEKYIERLNSEDRLGSAETYKSMMTSLKNFSDERHLDFTDVDVLFLNKYEKWMLENGKSITTVGIYLRSLRAIYNIAIDDNIIKKSVYPFGKRKYQIPQSRNIKKALSFENIVSIIQYEAQPWSAEERARDMWTFSYLCNGMNISDIARLRFSNIHGNTIRFVREKTKNTARQNQKLIEIALLDLSLEIIKKWGNKPAPDSYIFDILKKEYSIQQQRDAIKQAVKTINKYIQRIAGKLGINENITTYWARHSFSTILRNSGASTEYIKEALGHSNILTTEKYLDSFSTETKFAMAQKLLPPPILKEQN
ncbi:MAG TPA: recombinase XerD [Bacteroidales bacterium]|nr:recombinase XerD [Bacteroidales bacterium]